MVDIAPELLEKLRKSFSENFNKNKKIDKILSTIREGEPTYSEVNDLSIEVGDILAEVFQENLSQEILPDGRMYYNIAKRTVEPMMVNNYNVVSENAVVVQEILNKNAGMGIKAQVPVLNQSRIDGIIDRLDEAEFFDDIKWILDEPIKNFTQAVVDDSIKANADFQNKLGLKPKIIRKEVGNCCDWCKEVVGAYEYPDVPKDVYRRHRYCRCTVEYYPGDGRRQNVRSKKWIDPDKEGKIEERKKLSDDNKQISQTRKNCLAENVEYNEIKKSSVKKLEDEIIDYLGGGDETEGSCSSLALAYIGNKNGYDVLDFRDGRSRKIFSEKRSVIEIAELKGVKSFIENEHNDFAGIKKLIKNMEDGKEYYLATGKHVSIIRKNGEIFEYLELQTKNDNGFKRLSDKVLKDRFGCQKSHNLYGTKYQTPNILIDIESLNGNEEFEKMLGFINTAEANQVKGAGGYAK